MVDRFSRVEIGPMAHREKVAIRNRLVKLVIRA